MKNKVTVQDTAERNFTMNENPEYKNEIGDDVAIEASVADTSTSQSDESKKRLSSFVDYFEILTISILAVLLIFSLLVRVCRVDGGSMNQTLKNGEMLVISDFLYKPEQGDIVVFHLCQENGFNQPLVKRVIATEGQSVVIDITDRKVYVDGVELIEDYAYFKSDEYNLSYFSAYDLERDINGHLKFSVHVPEGKLFVMGDNRNGSTDSRSRSVGFVDEDTILGKALFRVAPFTIFK